MRNNPDEETQLMSTDGRDDETQALQTIGPNQIVDILMSEGERGSSLALVMKQYYAEGEIVGAVKEILLGILKKHQDKIAITPDLMEKLPGIIEICMKRSGYNIEAFRQRIRDVRR